MEQEIAGRFGKREEGIVFQKLCGGRKRPQMPPNHDCALFGFRVGDIGVIDLTEISTS